MARNRVKYPKSCDLRTELVRRVDLYFEKTGQPKRGGAKMYMKTAVVMTWLVGSYLALLLLPLTWWQAGLYAISVGLAMAGVGFTVQHDGGHGAYSRNPVLNRLGASALDLIGGSSFFWRYKHGVLHHHFTNVEGIDHDIDARPWLRMAESQPSRKFHRFQHWYCWPLYGFLPAKWLFFDDFRSLIKGKIGTEPVPRPHGWDLVQLLAGKLLFFFLAFALPIMLGKPWWGVILAYAVSSLVCGITLAAVFQSAHALDEATFRTVPEPGKLLPESWARHQLQTTVDFAPHNPLVTWYVGGLNFQVEHHLFPRIAHIHYPAISEIVKDVCEEFDVPYLRHDTVSSVLRSHVRYMKRLGQAA